MNRLNDLPTLLIQPNDEETSGYLAKLGFQPVPAIEQLLYRTVTKNQLADIFLQLSDRLSKNAQRSSRFVVTYLRIDSSEILRDFLRAQPLSALTSSIANAWFLRLLVGGGLFFKYQPIFQLNSGQVAAHECLARGLGDRAECYSGGQLIEAAVATELSCEFDELARITCIESIAAIGSDRTFFINILPNAIIRNPESLEQNLQQIIDLGLRCDRIVFELTEVEVLAQSDRLPQLIDKMREWGFGIAVDDLCGCVSVDHYAMELRPDIVKLDRRLVHGCSKYTLKQTLIESLLHSAHQEGILVLAEGLEDIEDIEFCRDLGVDFGQGFGLARPDVTLRQQPFEFCEYALSKAC